MRIPASNGSACTDPKGVSLLDDARSAGTVATITGIAGIVLVGAGVVLFVTAPSSSGPSVAVTPEYLLAHADLTGGPRYPKSYTNLALEYRLGTILLDGTEKLDGFPCIVVPSDMELPVSLKSRTCLRAYDTRSNTCGIQQTALVFEFAPDIAAGRRFGARQCDELSLSIAIEDRLNRR